MIKVPLSLYIHIPWCVRKCPYCDFNSHEAKTAMPESLYVDALIDELKHHLHLIQNRPINSIFFGGGTPSLFSAQSIGKILDAVGRETVIAENCEITLEANPGTIDQGNFHGFREAGINRLSLGIQSLQDDKLKILGRIHDRENAMEGIRIAKAAGFDNFNLDIMYGLPHQNLQDALSDIEDALSFAPKHFSWYQLTIEPNTVFYKKPPSLPADDLIFEMQLAGQEKLASAGYKQYEVSAYAVSGHECMHNRNYWEFGDYLGLGAGAHSKITRDSGEVLRFAQVRQPRDYLDASKRRSIALNTIAEKDLVFEFMLNALRLTEGVDISLFTERTGVSLDQIDELLNDAMRKGLLLHHPKKLCVSELGKRYLNNLVMMFL